MDENQCHIVMVPWLAFGHMIPFLELSNALAAKEIKISFFCTPRNIEKLRPMIPSHLTSRVHLLGFPLPAVAGLPENAESTGDLEQDAVQYLKKAYDMLQEPLEKLVKSTSPDLIIYDFAAYWVPQIATKLSITCFFYSTCSAGATTIFGSISERAVRTGKMTPEDMTLVDCFNFPSTVRLKLHEGVRLSGSAAQNVSGVSDAERMESAMGGCQSLLVRSCMEFEGEYVVALQELCQKPVIPVGLLPPAVKDDHQASKPSSPDLLVCFRWLDQQVPRSVVFVAFGTEARLSKEEIEAIAVGLELSNLPFCWILRKPSHVSASTAGGGEDDENVGVDDLLPPGFRVRTAKRGFISMSWVPQVKVLAHGSIGACLYHAGMSSTIEAVQFGLPLVLLPMVFDQGLVASLLVERNMGIEVERDERDGRFTGFEVAKALRLVMVEDEGKLILEKVREMKTSILDNQQLNKGYINRLIKLIRCRGKEEEEEERAAAGNKD